MLDDVLESEMSLDELLQKTGENSRPSENTKNLHETSNKGEYSVAPSNDNVFGDFTLSFF